MKKRLKKMIATVLTAAMAMSVGVPAFAASEQNKIDNVRDYFSIPIIGLLEIDNECDWEYTVNNKNIGSLSDEEKIELGRYTIEKALEYKEAGGYLIWNEIGVNTVIKDLYPDLFDKIKRQMDYEPQLLLLENISNGISRGNEGHRFSYTHLGLVGEKLYGVTTTFNWTWDDSTKVVTSVYPSSSAESYDLLWDPVGTGINKSNGYFNNGKTKYTHTTEGIFRFAYEGITYYAYPYMTVDLWAGGGAMVDGGIR